MVLTLKEMSNEKMLCFKVYQSIIYKTFCLVVAIALKMAFVVSIC